MEINSDLIRGHIDTIILKVLSEGDRYGYDIIKEIIDKSRGLYTLKVPTLYSCLKRLEVQGIIVARWGPKASGGRRKYYTLTDEGRTYFANNQAEWEFSRTVIDQLISDRPYDLTAVDYADGVSLEGADNEDESPETETAAAQDSGAEETLEENVYYAPQSAPPILEDEVPLEPAADALAPDSTPLSFRDIFSEIPDEPSYADNLSRQQAPVFNDSNAAADIPSFLEEEEADADEDEPYIVSGQESEDDYDPSSNINFDRYFGDQPESEVYQAPYYDPTRVEPEIPQDVPRAAGARPVFAEPEDDYKTKLSKLFVEEYQEPVRPAQQAPILTPDTETIPNDGVIVKQYSQTANREFKNQFYFYASKIRLAYFLILGLFILIETAVCNIVFKFTLSAPANRDTACYILAYALAVIFPLTAYILYKRDPVKRKRIDYDLRSTLVYRSLIFLIMLVVIFTFNLVFLELNVTSYGDNIITLFLPALLAVNFPISAFLYNALYKSKRYSVE